MAEPSLKTARLGGVEVPSADILEKMHVTEGCPYIYTMIVSHAPADRNCTLRSAGAEEPIEPMRKYHTYLDNRMYSAPAGRYVYRMAIDPIPALQRSAMFIESAKRQM